MRKFSGIGVTPSINLSTECDNSTLSCSQVDHSARLFFMLVYSLFFLVGLLLNGFTLKVYFCCAKQQTSSSVTIYLKNLAAADFLISLCLPLRISHFASCSATVQLVYCNFGASAFYLNMYASILFMGYVAANRYLKIVHPLGTHVLQTVRAAHIISTLTWVSLLAMMTSYVTLSLVTTKPLLSAANTLSCDVLHSTELSIFNKVSHACSAIIFMLVLFSLIFFYYSISRRLSQAQQRQPASPGSIKLTKSRRNMLVLVIVFCVCFVPYHLVRLLYTFLQKQCSWGQTFLYLKELTIIVSVLNVCLDPLIYFIFCKAFRAQLNMRKVFSSVNNVTHGVSAEKKSSDGRSSATIYNRKSSLNTTKPISVL